VTDTAPDRPELSFTVSDAVGWITIDRPAARNAMTRAMGARIGELLETARDDDAVAVVVITGTGPAFSAGLDRKEIAKGLEGKSEFPVELMVDYPKPTIAAINGLAYGGGATMAMACDLRVAAASATLTFGLGKVGLVPEWGSSYLLWRQIGYSRALDVMLTARTIAADEALAMGLVNRVVPDDELTSAVHALAQQIVALPPGTATAIKQVLRAGLDADFPAARVTETRMLGRRSRELAAQRGSGSGQRSTRA
jgi:2-(1,2-epoxy-1,2-dihydrophenyl)acetyl-CoA isomerase